MRRFWIYAGLCSVAWLTPVRAETFLILPFHNASRTPNLDWIGESIAESIQDSMLERGQIALGREQRLEAFRRLSIREHAPLTRASVMKLGDALDSSQVVYGEYTFDEAPAAASTSTSAAAGGAATPGPSSKGTLRITAHVIDLKRLRVGRDYLELGALEDLAALQTHLDWQTLQFLVPESAPPEADYLRTHPPIRVDAIENYVRGLLAPSDEQKQKFFAAATRLDARFSMPAFRLGQLHWQRRNYKAALEWLGKVPASNTHYRRATFFLGLCQYHLGDYSAAAHAFETVAATVPLNEVWNNLGAAQLRAGNAAAALESFRKALEGDTSDPDYHFNVGYALWKQGGHNDEAQQSLRAALERNPEDGQARQMLDRALKPAAASRAVDLRAEIAERLKLNYEESAYLQLKAMLEKK